MAQNGSGLSDVNVVNSIHMKLDLSQGHLIYSKDNFEYAKCSVFPVDNVYH